MKIKIGVWIAGRIQSMIRIKGIKEDHDGEKVMDNRDNLRNDDEYYEDDGNNSWDIFHQ